MNAEKCKSPLTVVIYREIKKSIGTAVKSVLWGQILGLTVNKQDVECKRVCKLNCHSIAAL